MRLRLGAIALLTLLGSGTALQAKGSVAYVPVREAADAPAGYIEMCQRAPTECGAGASAALAGQVPRRSTEATTEAALPTAAITLSTQGSLRPMLSHQAALTDLALLKLVNRNVNNAYVQQDDRITYGIDEYWQRPSLASGEADRAAPAAGDCEDFALEKRARLLAQGWPARRLRLAVVFHPDYGLHTILVARLDDGDYVLDSRVPKVMRWQKARYRWLRIQSEDHEMEWQRVAQG